MRGLKSTILLFVVLAGLLGYIYYSDRDGATGTDGEAKEQAFTSVTADEIEQIEIKSADGETTRVQKTDAKWNLVSPVQTAADESEVTAMTTSLAALDIQRVVEDNATDLKQYGLEPARIEVSFRKKGETQDRRLLLGEKTPTGGDLYARLPDQPRVFLVSSFIDTTFDKNTFALRDKSIISVEREKIDRVEIAAGDRSVTLAKSGMEWKLEQPIAARADFAAIEGALERLASGRMQAIVSPSGTPEELKKYRLDPPIASFTAVSGSSRATLLLGETENAVIYAKDASRPMVFTVAPTLYTDLVRDVQEFRRKDLFDSRSFTTSRIELRRGAETAVFEKSKSADGKETWKRADGKDADTAKVEDLLTKVSALRAGAFEAGTNPALKTPELTVVVRYDETKTEQVAFARAGNEVVANRPDEPGNATVDAMSFDEALKALDALK